MKLTLNTAVDVDVDVDVDQDSGCKIQGREGGERRGGEGREELYQKRTLGYNQAEDKEDLEQIPPPSC